MNEEVRKVLEHLILEEQLEVILDIIDTLLALDYGNALDEIAQIIMIADDYADSAMLVERINDILRTALDYILDTYEVKLTDEATALQRHLVVKTLIGIPLYILPDELMNHIAANYDNEETLAHIVKSLTNLDVDEALEVLMFISQGSIDHIKATIVDRMSIQGVALEHVTDITRVQHINKLISIFGKEKLSLLMELTNSGVRIGRTIEDLMNISFPALERMDIESATLEMIGLVWFSDTPEDQINTVVLRLINEYTENNMEVSMMVQAYNTYRKLYGA